MFIQKNGKINHVNTCPNLALGGQKKGRPHFSSVELMTVFVQMLEMPFDFSPNANVMRICSAMSEKSIEHIQ